MNDWIQADLVSEESFALNVDNQGTWQINVIRRFVAASSVVKMAILL
jgi:hypothetical protein